MKNRGTMKKLLYGDEVTIEKIKKCNSFKEEYYIDRKDFLKAVEKAAFNITNKYDNDREIYVYVTCKGEMPLTCIGEALEKAVKILGTENIMYNAEIVNDKDLKVIIGIN